MPITPRAKISAVFLALLTAACDDSGTPSVPRVVEGTCVATPGAMPDFLQSIGCRKDYDLLASEPLDASIPGARAVKFLVDRLGGDAVYFQNSQKYKIHHDFASKFLSGNGKPIVPGLMSFNMTEYYSAARRFVLGSITYYEGPQTWAMEIAPYDTADDKMVTRAYDAIVKATYFGNALYFHPTSTAVERLLPVLPKRILVKTTAQLFEKIDYQPLNLATAIGKLRFVTLSALETEYVAFREIVVLDRVPNDISVVSGIITQEFQTPLSHINVLSQNRKTPNMALRNAQKDPRLLALKDKWVRLRVGAFDYAIEEVTREVADQWWAANKPAAVGVPRLDESVRDLRDAATMLDQSMALRERIKAAIPAFGGKASHFAALTGVKDLPMPKPAFGIPVFFYRQFMTENGFDKKVDALLADPTFTDDARVRDLKLSELRAAMQAAPVNAAFEAMLTAKVKAALPGLPVRFRSSTNAEDLDGFTGAGLYTSETGHLDVAGKKSLTDAIRIVWASVWRLRAFDERTYRSIDHKSVGMALLVHHSFPAEEANGVALTANPFDTSGLQPGFYVNVQLGDSQVVMPEGNVTSDQFVYHYKTPGQPVVYIDHSSLVPKGQTVLTAKQIFSLGQALDAIHQYFMPAYGPKLGDPPDTWYAMDVEFKFDGEPGQEPVLFVKQARPHPGRGK